MLGCPHAAQIFEVIQASTEILKQIYKLVDKTIVNILGDRFMKQVFRIALAGVLLTFLFFSKVQKAHAAKAACEHGEAHKIQICRSGDCEVELLCCVGGTWFTGQMCVIYGII